MATLPSTLAEIRTDASDTRKDRKLEVNFGSGYIQRGANGINPTDRDVSISFVGTIAQIQVYIDFFDGLKGYQNFQWTHPNESTEYNWVVGDRTISYPGADLVKLSTTFTRDFSLAT